MQRTSAAAGSAVFFILAPGVVAGLVPWWLSGWTIAEPRWPAPVRVLGVLLLLAGAAALVHSFVRFVVEGAGTPAPIAPTKRLVVGGLYRYVRNPMYLAVLGTITGQALWLCRDALLLYAVAVFAAFASFVRWYEEPTLFSRFGADYSTYRRAVPGWWPRLRPWEAGSDGPR